MNAELSRGSPFRLAVALTTANPLAGFGGEVCRDRASPFEVESACLEHPALAEAAAVASPDERRGHVAKAFIVAASGREPSDDQTWPRRSRRSCATATPPMRIPA